MRRKKVARGLVLAGIFLFFIVPLFFSVGCANLQDQWEKLTPNERAAVILTKLQSDVDALLDGGIAYIQANPQHQETWKTKVLPAIEIANHALRDAMILSQTEGITPQYVYATVSPLVEEVVRLLAVWGITAQAERGYIT